MKGGFRINRAEDLALWFSCLSAIVLMHAIQSVHELLKCLVLELANSLTC